MDGDARDAGRETADAGATTTIRGTEDDDGVDATAVVGAAAGTIDADVDVDAGGVEGMDTNGGDDDDDDDDARRRRDARVEGGVAPNERDDDDGDDEKENETKDEFWAKMQPFPEKPATFCAGTIIDHSWTRPRLVKCSMEDFMFDFMRFHHTRGRDWEQCWANLDRLMSRTGKPCDPCHFYKQVCAAGGFQSRESAKLRIRATEIFKNLHNYYDNHTMTDVGNRLLSMYEDYFLEYEQANEEDVSRGVCSSCRGGAFPGPGSSGVLHECMTCLHLYHGHCQPPEIFPKCFGKGCNAGVSMQIVCSKCVVRSVTQETVNVMHAKQNYEAQTYYVRLYECVARRGRTYKASYVRPTRMEDTTTGNETVIFPSSATTSFENLPSGKDDDGEEANNDDADADADEKEEDVGVDVAMATAEAS
jgi:hypothetical protein